MARSLKANTAESDAVQADPFEGMRQHQLGRLGAVATAPGVALADRDVEEHRAVVGGRATSNVVRPIRRSVAARGWRRRASRRRGSRLMKKRSISSCGMGRVWYRVRRASSGSRYQLTIAAGSPSGAGAATTRRPSMTEGFRSSRSADRSRFTRMLPPASARRRPRAAARYHRGMRQWSETADRIAATTRTSEKVAAVSTYLRGLAAEELPIAVVFLAGRPFPERDARTTGIGWAAIGAVAESVAGAPRERCSRRTTSRPTSARRSATCWRARVTSPGASRPRSPTSRPPSPPSPRRADRPPRPRSWARCWNAVIP